MSTELPPKLPDKITPQETAQPILWKIPIPPLLGGMTALCFVYVFLDGTFLKDINSESVSEPARIVLRFAGHLLVAAIMIPAGVLIGVLLWAMAWLLEKLRLGGDHYSFRPFILAGMVSYMVIIFGGKTYLQSESGQDWVRSVQSGVVRKEFKRLSPQLVFSNMRLRYSEVEENDPSLKSIGTLEGLIKNNSPKSVKQLVFIITIRDENSVFATHQATLDKTITAGSEVSLSLKTEGLKVPAKFKWHYELVDGEFY